MNQYQILILLITLTGYLHGNAATQMISDNVIIDDEIHTYTILEKNGEISSVISEKETTYTAQRTDGFADVWQGSSTFRYRGLFFQRNFSL